MIIPPENLEDIARKFGFGKYAKKELNKNSLKQKRQKHKYITDEEVLTGKPFYSEEKNNKGQYIGIVEALEQALEYAGSEGVVATMPELIAAKIKADKSHEFWKNWYTVHTEENIGINKKGIYFGNNEPVLIVVHGGGILTPKRIRQAYEEGLIKNSATYTEEEFNNLLEGKLENTNGTIPIYTIDQIKKGISNLPHQFGIVMPYKTAQASKSDWHNKKDFMENPLIIARAGGTEKLEKYFEKAKNSNENAGNWQIYTERDATQAQGRLLFLSSSYYGLDGSYDLNFIGRFVWVVAPEVPVGAPNIEVLK